MLKQDNMLIIIYQITSKSFLPKCLSHKHQPYRWADSCNAAVTECSPKLSPINEVTLMGVWRQQHSSVAAAHVHSMAAGTGRSACSCLPDQPPWQALGQCGAGSAAHSPSQDRNQAQSFALPHWWDEHLAWNRDKDQSQTDTEQVNTEFLL